MSKYIKTRQTIKTVKTLEKTANLSKRMKSALVSTKQKAEETQAAQHDTPTEYATDSFQSTSQDAASSATHRVADAPRNAKSNTFRAKEHFGEVQRQLPTERKRAADSAKRTADTMRHKSEQLRKTADNTKDAANKAHDAVKNAKQALGNVRQTGRQTVRNARTAHNATAKTAKLAKRLNKGVKQTAKGAVKTAKRTVKTAEQSARRAVKTAQQTAKAAKHTAQVAMKTAKAAERAARVAAKAAAKAAQVAVKTVMALVKATIAAIKGIVAAIAAGGWVAVLIILVICLVGLLVGSVFGIFFADEPTSNADLTVATVTAEIEAEYQAEIDTIITDNAHDELVIDGYHTPWNEILAVYAIKVNTDPDNPTEVVTMDEAKAAILRTVFWDMTTIGYELGTVEVEQDKIGDNGTPTGENTTVIFTVLRITIIHKTTDEMAAAFSNSQQTQLVELLKSKYDSLWNELLYGITTIGDGS